MLSDARSTYSSARPIARHPDKSSMWVLRINGPVSVDTFLSIYECWVAIVCGAGSIPLISQKLYHAASPVSRMLEITSNRVRCSDSDMRIMWIVRWHAIES